MSGVVTWLYVFDVERGHSYPMPSGLSPHPGGMFDNSPTFQRWVPRQEGLSPEGTADQPLLPVGRPFETKPCFGRRSATLKPLPFRMFRVFRVFSGPPSFVPACSMSKPWAIIANPPLSHFFQKNHLTPPIRRCKYNVKTLHGRYIYN